MALASAASRRPLTETLRRVRFGRGMFVATIAAGIVQYGCTIVASGTGGWLVGAIVRTHQSVRLLPALVVLALAVVGATAGTWAAGWFAHTFAYRYQAHLRVQIFDGLERSAPRNLLGQRTGDLAETAMNDIDALENFFAHLAVDVTVAVAVGFGAVVALALVHPLFALIATAGMLASTILPGVIAARTKLWGQRLRGQLGELAGDAVDGIQGLRELVTFGEAEAFGRRLVAKTRAYKRLQLHYAIFTGLDRATTDGLVAATTVSILIASVMLTASGNISILQALVAVTLTAGALAPVTLATNVAGQLAPLRASAERVLTIVDQPAQIADRATTPPPAGPPAVRFRDVWFGYDPGEAVLRGVDFSIAAGETVALVGSSGAGKSTCVNLLLRFWDVDGGAISLGGQDLRAFPLADLRRLIALVPQDVYLFNVSVAENLRLGQTMVTQAQIEAAARAANAHEFIVALPEGYETRVGERGDRLSGGQRQRLAIARALLHDSPVLILDEAASNLDTENEQEVQHAVATARRGRTTLVIAHRLSTILSASRIVVLDGGRVVESGTHAELVSAKGSYARLIAEQQFQPGAPAGGVHLGGG